MLVNKQVAKMTEQQLAERFERVVELTKSIAKMPPLREALQLVTDTAMELLPADHVSARLLDENQCNLVA